MVGYSKDFGYGLLGNNVIGGVVNGVDQIYGVMIMNDIAFHRTDQFKTVTTSTYMKTCNFPYFPVFSRTTNNYTAIW